MPPQDLALSASDDDGAGVASSRRDVTDVAMASPSSQMSNLSHPSPDCKLAAALGGDDGKSCRRSSFRCRLRA